MLYPVHAPRRRVEASGLNFRPFSSQRTARFSVHEPCFGLSAQLRLLDAQGLALYVRFR